MSNPKPSVTVLSRVMIEIVQEGDGLPFVVVKHERPITPVM